jgi:hypothetical protein
MHTTIFPQALQDDLGRGLAALDLDAGALAPPLRIWRSRYSSKPARFKRPVSGSRWLNCKSRTSSCRCWVMSCATPTKPSTTPVSSHSGM